MKNLPPLMKHCILLSATMLFKHKNLLLTNIIGLGLGIGLSSCSTSAIPFIGEQSTSSNPAPSPTASTSPAASIQPASPSPSPTPKPKSKVPLTYEKLKNTEYYILAEGPVKLTNGKFQDKKKRKFELGTVYSYGDLNRDGIKDAIAPLTITINGRKFTYLVGVINENGQPRNASAEFLGEDVKVKTVSANAGKIVVKMDKYGPDDPACCPSQTVTRNYTFKPFKSTEDEKKDSKNKKSIDSKSKDKKTEDPKKKEESKSTKDNTSPPSPEESPKD